MKPFVLKVLLMIIVGCVFLAMQHEQPTNETEFVGVTNLSGTLHGIVHQYARERGSLMRSLTYLLAERELSRKEMKQDSIYLDENDLLILSYPFCMSLFIQSNKIFRETDFGKELIKLSYEKPPLFFLESQIDGKENKIKIEEYRRLIHRMYQIEDVTALAFRVRKYVFNSLFEDNRMCKTVDTELEEFYVYIFVKPDERWKKYVTKELYIEPGYLKNDR